jgi:chemotaxis protein MotB
MARHRVRRRDHEEEHESEERWLITYADMITLLMVLFIVLFSIGQTDLAKFEKLKAGLADTFGERGAAVVLAGGSGVLDGGDSPLDEETAQEILEAQQAATVVAERQLRDTAETIKETLAGQGLGDQVTFRFEDRGLVLQVVSDQVLFDLGKAELRPEGRQVLDGLAGALRELPNKLAVEGHTDNRPISGFPFASNWELASMRATTVLRYLVEQQGIDRKRISAAGFGEEHPIAPNDTPANQARNRRVEVVVLAPAIAGVLGDGDGDHGDTGGSAGNEDKERPDGSDPTG